MSRVKTALNSSNCLVILDDSEQFIGLLTCADLIEGAERQTP